MTVPMVVGIFVAMAVALTLIGMRRVVQPAGEVEDRIEKWVQSRGRGGEAAGPTLKEINGSMLGRLDRTVTRQGFAASMKEDLAQADLTITVTEYMLIRLGVVVLFFLLGFLAQRNMLIGLLFAVGGFFVPTIYVRARQRQRLRKFDSQLPDVLDHLQGSLRAGYGLLQAVDWVSRQLPKPVGPEFDRVMREVQLGRNLLEALESMVRRIPSDDLSLIVTAIKIQYEVGGNLTEILETVAYTIRERVRIQREISVLTAQQRLSGYVLMFLPIGMGIFMLLVNPDYIMGLFTPGPTLCLPVGAAVLMIVGFFVMRRIVDIEV